MGATEKFAVSKCANVACSCIAFNVRRADRYITQLYDEALRPAGVRSTQFSLLVGIRAMEPVTLGSISAQLGIDRTTLTRNLAVLEQQGLASREAGEDLRERQFTLTRKGHRALERAYPLWESVQARLQESLGSSDLRALLHQLAHLGPQKADHEAR